MTSLTSMQAFVDTALDVYGRVDLLVNSAGIMPLSRLEARHVDEWTA